MNGNLENKSAIADLVFNGGGDPANDNGFVILTFFAPVAEIRETGT